MTIRKSIQKSIPGLRESREWIRNNAAGYRGKWIAVYNGSLLGATETLKELKDTVDLTHAIVVKVLEEDI